MARLLADECVTRSVIERLRADGHDVVAAADICPSDEDPVVLARAYEDNRVLVTADYDFGELVVRMRQPARGVVNLALGDLAATTRGDIAVRRFRELGDRVIGNFVTIEPARVRIRPLPPSGS